MAIEDPVLQREMFRSRRKDVEGAGIAAIPSDANEEGYNRRVEEAKALFEQARIQQDPSRFQTLREQDKPGAFRPIQAATTQMPQANIQQQMAQMQAMGFRPVGMANGGYVKHFREGGENRITPTVSPIGSETTDTSLTPAGESAYSGLGPDPSQWTDADIENYASGIATLSSPSELSRKIRTIRNIRDQALVNKSVTREREITREKEFPKVTPRTPMSEEEKAVIRRRTEQPDLPPVTEFPDTTSAAQVAGGSGTYLPKVEEDLGGISAAQVAGGSGDYLGKVSGIGALDTAEADRETRRATALSNMPSPEQAPVPVSPQEEAKKSNVFDTYSTNLEQIKADRAAQRKENIGLALMQAGLAIAGGTSPNALTNIGQGGISGLQAFGQGEKESRMDYRQAIQDLRAEQEAARGEAYRQRSIGLQEEAQKFKREVEFPETMKLREAQLDAARMSKTETAITKTADVYGRRIDQIDNRLKDIQSDYNTPEPAKKAEIERLTKERDSLLNKWNNLLIQSGYGVPDQPAAAAPAPKVVSFGDLK